MPHKRAATKWNGSGRPSERKLRLRYCVARPEPKTGAEVSMSPLDMLEEVALLSLLVALAFSYVLDRLHLIYYGRHAREIVAGLEAMEARLRAGDEASLEEYRAAVAQLAKLERRLTSASKRLISWRSSPVERFIIGPHIDRLLFQYERAGAMTTRLTAMWVRTEAGEFMKRENLPARPRK
jgi:hypothetical protein